ncbi:MBL fold metallo-hydrolase [Aureimonas sp. Leaf454]|uniref:quinoprotein relay system zinc metallohydrolase 2 n=1 Tax=Aureimonas sp. Leaf454 TaxID=1736381 RepID=UPI0006FB1EA4|nr:quinoprotein relay system zinc metallohydrolase 2 [Aureimonas sp. Leaf454]KQT47515.1 MBL fold metallo-hydrolase [Aureimonas sp. Leaf454]
MIRRRDILGVLATLPLPMSALPGSALAQSAGAAAATPTETTFVEVAEGVHVRVGPVEEMTPHNRGGVANLGFVVGREAVAAIDSGGNPAEGAAMIAAIRRVTDRPIRHLVATHMHPDHIFGNQAFKAIGAEIVGHHRLAAALGARAESYAMSMTAEIGAAAMAGLVVTLPDTGVADERVLDLGGRTLRLKAWDTAHTDNDLTAFDETSGLLFAGDLVFLDHLPVIDGSLKGWLAQVPALKAVPARAVVPGHGPATAPWPTAIDRQTAYLEALARDIRQALAEGRTLAETVGTAAQDEARSWKLADAYAERNATAAFAELEWE